MATAAQKEAVYKYDRDHTVRISLKLNKRTDADILAWLEKKENKQGYIKDMIRKDMEK